MHPADLEQSDLDLRCDQPQWVSLRLMVQEIDEQIVNERVNALVKVSNWLMAVRIFRKYEDACMISRDPHERERRYHEAVLLRLLGFGKMILLDLQRSDNKADPSHLNLQLADIEAAVEMLAGDYRGWYGGMTEARRSAVLRDVFDVEEPKA